MYRIDRDEQTRANGIARRRRTVVQTFGLAFVQTVQWHRIRTGRTVPGESEPRPETYFSPFHSWKLTGQWEPAAFLRMRARRVRLSPGRDGTPGRSAEASRCYATSANVAVARALQLQINTRNKRTQTNVAVEQTFCSVPFSDVLFPERGA